MNHVIPRELVAADILQAIDAAAPTPTTLSSVIGTKLEAVSEDDDIFITPVGTDITAQVIVSDVQTCAGTVHVIDAVLVPDGPEPVESEQPSGAYGNSSSGGY